MPAGLVNIDFLEGLNLSDPEHVNMVQITVNTCNIASTGVNETRTFFMIKTYIYATLTLPSAKQFNKFSRYQFFRKRGTTCGYEANGQPSEHTHMSIFFHILSCKRHVCSPQVAYFVKKFEIGAKISKT